MLLVFFLLTVGHVCQILSIFEHLIYQLFCLLKEKGHSIPSVVKFGVYLLCIFVFLHCFFVSSSSQCCIIYSFSVD